MLVRHCGRLVLERGGWLVDPERRQVAGQRLALKELQADEELPEHVKHVEWHVMHPKLSP